MTNHRIIIAGGSGFLGQMLSCHLAGRGYVVTILTRQPKASGTEVWWDGATLGSWADCLDGARALINLAGRSVNCRYHARNRQQILRSRVDSTRVLGEAIRQCARPPRVWLNSSTATIYKHTLNPPMDEAGEIGATPEAKDAFSIEVACAWEAALANAHTPATRQVALRTAMVLDTARGTVFRVLRRLVLAGLGGRMGSGEQFVSWIHSLDFCRAIEWLIEREDISGHINLAAPQPLPNRELMSLLRQLCHRPFGLPATRWMLEAGAFVLGTEPELILKSRRVVPGRLTASGFSFVFPELRAALEDLCHKVKASENILVSRPARHAPVATIG